MFDSIQGLPIREITPATDVKLMPRLIIPHASEPQRADFLFVACEWLAYFVMILVSRDTELRDLQTLLS